MRWSSVVVALLFAGSASAQDGALRVTGGAPSAPGAWPDASGIVFRNYVGCTGTLVAPDVVLTAGHCVARDLTDVLIGSSDTRSDEGEVIGVIDMDYHSRADIAVLKLERPSVYEPRAIAMGCVLDEYLYDGAPVAIVGYGATDRWGNQYTSKLMEGFSAVTDHDCSATNRGCDPALSPGGEIGAGGYQGDGVDACFGDSGGPLYLLTEVGDYLVGVTSRAFYDVNAPCGEGGIWVRPDAFIEWIERVGEVDIPDPTCNFPPVVEDDALTVPQGKKRKSRIAAEDPEGDTPQFLVVEPPAHGEVELFADGSYEYRADADYIGPDGFVVQVRDETGYPIQRVLAYVDIEVVERTFLGCACDSGASPAGGVGALGLLGALGLVRRRRQAVRI